MATKPYILLTAGHRSTGDPGNPTEKDRTDDMARAYQKAFKADGYEVDYWQTDLDRDGTPDMTHGDLSTVATGVRNVFLGRKDSMAIMLDLHFNGPESTLFTIVPDCIGLRSGYSDGAPSDDTAAHNTLDVQVAQAISQEISAKLGGKALYNGRLGVRGVMSERETGVALDGNWRLGMFGGTAIVRHRVVRLVVEHGGYNDFTRYSDFPARCAAGAVAAINGVFDVANVPPKEDPKPDPVPVPGPVPEFTWPEGMDLPVAQLLFGSSKANNGAVYKFDVNGDISRAWIARGKETGDFSPLLGVQIYDAGKPNQRQYFQFGSGVVLWRPSSTAAFRPMGLDVVGTLTGVLEGVIAKG